MYRFLVFFSNYLTAVITDMILIRIFVVRNRLYRSSHRYGFYPPSAQLSVSGEYTSIHRAFAGMRTVAVRFPFVEGMPIVDCHGHFGGVAGLIGDDNFAYRPPEREQSCLFRKA